jgi:hypothetical protein
MNATEFSFNAKLGLLNARRSRPISTKGTISDIRKRTEESLRPPGFHTYGNLGSQNAITTSPTSNEAKLVIDIETPKGTETSVDTGKVSEIKKDAERDKKAESIQPPKTSSPFNTDTEKGRKELGEWREYLRIKFWRLNDTQYEPYKYFSMDSINYTRFLKERVKAFQRIEKHYKEHPFDRFADAIMPTLVSLGHLGLNWMAEEVKASAKALTPPPNLSPGQSETPEAKQRRESDNFLKSILPIETAINKARDFIDNILPKKYTSYEEATMSVLNAVLDAQPSWRAKMKKDGAEAMRKFIEELTGDNINNGGGKHPLLPN